MTTQHFEKVGVAVLAALLLSACAEGSKLGGDGRLVTVGGPNYGIDQPPPAPMPAQPPPSPPPLVLVLPKAEPAPLPADRARGMIYFATNSAELTQEGIRTLALYARELKARPTDTATIEGHADERGNRAYNVALGARRATSVQKHLMMQGIAASRIRIVSLGQDKPVAACKDDACWTQNRRVQIKMTSAVRVSKAHGGPSPALASR